MKWVVNGQEIKCSALDRQEWHPFILKISSNAEQRLKQFEIERVEKIYMSIWENLFDVPGIVLGAEDLQQIKHIYCHY